MKQSRLSCTPCSLASTFSTLLELVRFGEWRPDMSCLLLFSPIRRLDTHSAGDCATVRSRSRSFGSWDWLRFLRANSTSPGRSWQPGLFNGEGAWRWLRPDDEKAPAVRSDNPAGAKSLGHMVFDSGPSKQSRLNEW